MLITLHPQAGDYTSSMSLSGLVLTIDGVDYDLSQIEEGGDAMAPLPFSQYHRQSREHVHIVYRYDQQKAENEQPEETYDIQSGECPCPIVWKPAKEDVV